MKFYWCLTCGRTFLESPTYTGNCVLTDCDGDTDNLMPWETARANHPEYPAIPVPRAAYHLWLRQVQTAFH